MRDVRIFENSEFGEIRTVTVDNNPMFCLADVCKALELTQPSKVKERLNENEPEFRAHFFKPPDSLAVKIA